jgi:hypothetical protein
LVGRRGEAEGHPDPVALAMRGPLLRIRQLWQTTRSTADTRFADVERTRSSVSVTHVSVTITRIGLADSTGTTIAGEREARRRWRV